MHDTNCDVQESASQLGPNTWSGRNRGDSSKQPPLGSTSARVDRTIVDAVLRRRSRQRARRHRVICTSLGQPRLRSLVGTGSQQTGTKIHRKDEKHHSLGLWRSSCFDKKHTRSLIVCVLCRPSTYQDQMLETNRNPNSPRQRHLSCFDQYLHPSTLLFLENYLSTLATSTLPRTSRTKAKWHWTDCVARENSQQQIFK